MTTRVDSVTTDNFEERVLAANGPVLVDFFADWCGPCQSLKPILDDLAGDFDGRAQVHKVDVDNDPELAQIYGVRGIPTLVLFNDGKIVDTLVGLRSKAELTALLDEVA